MMSIRMHLIFILAFVLESSFSFQFPTRTVPSSTVLFAKVRKAKRKVEKSRSKQFFDAMDDANDRKEKKKKGDVTAVAEPDTPVDAEEEGRRAMMMSEAEQRMESRPEVSTMIVDEDTGFEIVAQGKSVMDVVTRKPVKLSSFGPEYRLAQMFPGVPPEVREKYRFDWKTVEVPEMVEALREACSVKLEDGSKGIPPHPSIANKAMDFVLANRDLMGDRMKRTLARLQLRSMSQGDKEEAIENQKLYKNFLTLENHISAPFRQMLMDGEGRVGPNFGNLDIKSYCNGDVYQRCADYLVLKGMVAHWEKKVIDADYTEKTPQTKSNYMTVLSRGDPKRYLPDPPILFTLKECTQVCYMSQQMTKAFVDCPELFNDLPPEVRFIELALTIKGGTPLRQFVIEDFCPAEGITPEGLREGLRRLIVQLQSMQIDPYADITNTLEKLSIAMAVGTDDERDPYTPYLFNTDPNGPGAFQTYTFNHEKLSLVRFLDSQYGGSNSDDGGGGGDSGFAGMFNFGGSKPKDSAGTPADEDTFVYKVPDARAAKRPHELGWLQLLDDQKSEKQRFGKVPPGRIIPDDE